MEAAANLNTGVRAASGEAPERRGSDLWRDAMLSAEHHARYWWAAQAVAGLRVLDVGCGAGQGTGILAAAGPEEVVGVDIAPEAISVAMERFGAAAAFRLGDLTALPFDSGSFDVVVGFEVIDEVTDLPGALEELRRVLRPDGSLLVSARNRSVSADSNSQQLTTCELSQQLGRVFGHVRMFEQSDWFMSAVMEHSDSRSTDMSRPLPVELRKEVGVAADREPFAVAAASNGTLPDLQLGVSVACSPGGPEEHLRQRVFLQRELEQAFARENALRREHHALGERLWQVAERNEIELARAAADIDCARRSVVAMQGSVSWRITRPIRALNNLFRRRS